MKPEDWVVDLIAAANPVPDSRGLDDGADRIPDTSERSISAPPAVGASRPSARKLSWRGRVAAGVAVAVVVAASVWLLAIEPGRDTDVVDQGATTSLQVAVEALRAYESGDIGSWQSAWDPDATWQQTTSVGITYSGEYFGTEGVFDYGRRTAATDWNEDGEVTISDIEARSLAEFHASSGEWNEECETDGITVACRVNPTTAFGTWFFSNTQLADRGGETPGTLTIRVADGLVTALEIDLEPLDRSVVVEYQNAQRNYWAWVQDGYPELSNDLLGPSVGQLIFSPDNYRQHRVLIDEWSVEL